MLNIRELIKAHGKPPREVYFDHENSGRPPREVVEAMMPYFNEVGYGHPSITNKPGWEACEVVYETAELLSKTINAEPSEINFTHSGTEANNLAVVGASLAKLRKAKLVDKPKVILSAIEHPSVLFPADRVLPNYGFKVIKLPVDEYGFVDPDVLSSVVDGRTVLVSVQAVNNEVGTVQRLGELVKSVKDVNPDALFHTDATAAYGRIPIDVKKLDVDLLSVSSHKILGPKGAGALFVREGVEVESLLHGALSSQRLWPGVENVPALAGFKKAIELAFDKFEENVGHMTALRDRLVNGIVNSIPHVLLNGPSGSSRAPDNVNLSFLYIEGEALTVELSLRGIYVSSGSACTSRVLEPSHVLLAIGRKHEEAHGSILFKVAATHSTEDVDYVLESLPISVARLRKISSSKPGDQP